jgi:glycosyltransferase involved in cell wall biosynthesis
MTRLKFAKLEYGMPRLNVIFYGYPFEPTGYGAASRAYIRALCGAGVNVSVVNLNPQPHSEVTDSLLQTLVNRPLTPDLHICHDDTTQLARLASFFPRVIFLTTWETDRLPKHWIRLLNRVLEVWVPCSHNVAVFTRSIKTPIFRLPHAFVPTTDSAFSSTTQLCANANNHFGIRHDDFVFYTVATWQERKHPMGVIRAFLEAFDQDPQVVLIIKTSLRWTDERQIRTAITSLIREEHPTNRARILVYTGSWPEQALVQLANRANCYVSLHRGEGWGYPLFQAACEGTPVIATNYGGPADYLDSRYHNLVDYTMVPVLARFLNFDPGMEWADPDLREAAALMRYVRTNHPDASRRAIAGSQLLKTRYSIDAIGKMALDRLVTLRERLHDANYGPPWSRRLNAS